MPLLEKHLIVKRSKIPGCGMGLFTRKFIAKGTLIVEYKGRIINWKAGKKNTGNGYMYFINNNRVIDAGKRKSALARYANDAFGIIKIEGVTNNCIYFNDGQKAFIQSVKDIAAGSEILVRYGKEYWDVRKANIAIERKLAAGNKGSRMN
jgi:SET domain-containing protein